MILPLGLNFYLKHHSTYCKGPQISKTNLRKKNKVGRPKLKTPKFKTYNTKIQ